MKPLYLFLLLIPLIAFSDETQYFSIFRGEERVAVSEIISSKGKISERVLWLDGFSKEYTESFISLTETPEYSSKTYYENDKLPIIISLRGNRFEKRFSDKLISTSLREEVEFIHRNSNIILFLSFAKGINKKINCYDSDRMENFTAEFIKGEIYVDGKDIGDYYAGKSLLDSAKLFGLKIVREKEKILVKNPYTINLSKIYTEDDFTLKKRHIQFSFDCFEGEIAFDKPSDTLVVILPFSFSSDMNGNSGSSIRPFTVLQIAEYIKSPALLLQISLKPEERTKLPQKIADIEKELLKSYGRVLFIAFNDICIDLAESRVKSDKIMINPPLPEVSEWSDMMFARYSVNSKYLFKSKEKFMEYEGLSPLKNKTGLASLYSAQQPAIFVFSSSVLSDAEASAAKRIKGKVYYIKNIDRRLNSYNIYDLWSFEKNVFINRKILDFINGLATQ